MIVLTFSKGINIVAVLLVAVYIIFPFGKMKVYNFIERFKKLCPLLIIVLSTSLVLFLPPNSWIFGLIVIFCNVIAMILLFKRENGNIYLLYLSFSGIILYIILYFFL